MKDKTKEFIKGLSVSFGSAVALGFVASIFGTLLILIAAPIAIIIFLVLNASYVRNEKDPDKRRGLECGFVFFFLPALIYFLIVAPFN